MTGTALLVSLLADRRKTLRALRRALSMLQSVFPLLLGVLAVISLLLAAVPPATLAAIRAAFADLTEKAQPGDFIYLHFSGHGTQAPALDPDSELDGLDELFLPVDIGKWNDSVGAVENALVDDEIGALIDGLRAKGADVWVVFDSCPSGTATRSLVAMCDCTIVALRHAFVTTGKAGQPALFRLRRPGKVPLETAHAFRRRCRGI